ncbi:MAG TPA: pyruvate kinase [Jatrophihabitantaceae bacterium]|nr:pyruvate kinase [Jatrophihabitantaceae bacterium]
MNRRAKIVCTLGPASAGRLPDLIEAGMDVARLNFSHGIHSDHAATYRLVREAAARSGRNVGILADLQGPKIRLGRFADGPVGWATGETVVITTERCPGDHDRVSTTYTGLAGDVRPGDRLLIDDGKVALEVTSMRGHDVSCLVVEGGTVSDNKGISLPGVDVSVPPLSEKDIEDLRLALALGVDLVAMSFVRSPAEIKLAHAVMDDVGGRVPVIAKLEKPEAVQDLDGIVAAFDGIMVARGDLGVEMPLEEIPLIQKRTIQLCREVGKPVIVATQMLDSMVENSRPTRAETSDVANAVLDGADAVMLSAETSVGAHPVSAVRTMAQIVEFAEKDAAGYKPPLRQAPTTTAGAIAAAATAVGSALNVKALCCFTCTGDTARLLARHHSGLPLLAFTPDESVCAALSVSWGVETFRLPPVENTDDMVRRIQDLLLSLGRFERGDAVVIVAGSPPGIAGSTNAMRVWRLGDEVC